jgi:uncharacterized Zn-binding protein involved in type VI secretion
VLHVINTNMTVSQPADFGMPVFGRPRVSAAPITCAPAAVAAGSKSVLIDGTPVSAYGRTDVVLEGNFPGTSAWSPPI